MANPNRIEQLIRGEIARAGGVLPWERVMHHALYAPGGYYRDGVRRIGRGGDFYTSVSVGPLFGELLGVFIARVWRALDCPDDFALIEQGAHGGTLAADVLRGLQKHEPTLFDAARVIIIEGSEALRSAQREALEPFGGKLRHIDSEHDLHGETGLAVLYCNELLDAMPVHRVRFTRGGWREIGVAVKAADSSLEFVEMEISSESLAAELHRIGDAFPEGYEANINLAMIHWLHAIAESPFRGALLTFDYGMAEAECLSPTRPNSPLRRYRHHQCDERVLEDLGECDLTTHVNFTHFANECIARGFSLVEFIEQGRFLTALAAEMWSRSAPPDAAMQRQFQALTHPGIMGCSFHALTLAKGIDPMLFVRDDQVTTSRRRLGI
jgi:SAM-dependent MidA family methyltransferase